MELREQDIKSIDTVGRSSDGKEILHIVSKGGLHLFAKRTETGLHVLGKGGNRGLARHLTSLMEKNIQWDQKLFKSEDFVNYQEESIIAESNDENHKIAGEYHAIKATQEQDAHKRIHHLLKSKAHFLAANYNEEDASKSVNEAVLKSEQGFLINPPFSTEMLEIAYENKTKKNFPRGLK